MRSRRTTFAAALMLALALGLGLAGAATDAQIIAELINRGKLLTDVPPGG